MAAQELHKTGKRKWLTPVIPFIIVGIAVLLSIQWSEEGIRINPTLIFFGILTGTMVYIVMKYPGPSSVMKPKTEAKAFKNCPYCRESFNVPQIPKYCPYCKGEL